MDTNKIRICRDLNSLNPLFLFVITEYGVVLDELTNFARLTLVATRKSS